MRGIVKGRCGVAGLVRFVGDGPALGQLGAGLASIGRNRSAYKQGGARNRRAAGRKRDIESPDKGQRPKPRCRGRYGITQTGATEYTRVRRFAAGSVAHRAEPAAWSTPPLVKRAHSTGARQAMAALRAQASAPFPYPPRAAPTARRHAHPFAESGPSWVVTWPSAPARTDFARPTVAGRRRKPARRPPPSLR